MFEFRDETWFREEIYSLLRARNFAVAAVDSPFYPAPRPETADFTFFRMHGGRGSSAPLYDGREMEALAVEVSRVLDERRDVFVYFNNDYRGYAVVNALALKDLLGVKDGDVRA
ncbi:MAG: DUF72 domain-containing protein [Candidatus Geothermincolia bacterium]